MLDAIQQRIVGVMVEKELTVPDSYPLTENSLLIGCNQKSNRDPEMALTATDLHPALLFLREDGWLVRIDSGGRVVRYRHKVMERLNIGREQMIVITELLLRGPQAPGALKPRIARMGLHAEPARIERSSRISPRTSRCRSSNACRDSRANATSASVTSWGRDRRRPTRAKARRPRCARRRVRTDWSRVWRVSRRRSPNCADSSTTSAGPDRLQRSASSTSPSTPK